MDYFHGFTATELDLLKAKFGPTAAELDLLEAELANEMPVEPIGVQRPYVEDALSMHDLAKWMKAKRGSPEELQTYFFLDPAEPKQDGDDIIYKLSYFLRGIETGHAARTVQPCIETILDREFFPQAHIEAETGNIILKTGYGTLAILSTLLHIIDNYNENHADPITREWMIETEAPSNDLQGMYHRLGLNPHQMPLGNYLDGMIGYAQGRGFTFEHPFEE